MPLYEYKAITQKGNRITGTYEAHEISDVVPMLRDKGYYPVQIKKIRTKNISAVPRGIFGRMPLRDLMIFCRQFSTIINAKVPILTGLDILRKQIENTRLRDAVNVLYEEVQKGKSMSAVMGMHKDVFPGLFVNLVMAGEVSGTLGNVLERIAVHYEKEYRVKQRIKNALIYPSLIAIVALLVVIFLIVIVLPSFDTMFQQMGAMLPLLTRLLIRLSHIIRKRFVLLVLGLAVFLFCAGWYFNTDNGKKCFDRLILKAPVIGITTKKMFTARFARTLGTLISNGIPLLRALEITKAVVGNTRLQKNIEIVERGIKKGKGLAGPLKDVEDFPPMLACMANIGEDTGTLGQTLLKTAELYDEEVDNALKRMTVLIEPIIIIVMAVTVAFIVLSIVLPMVDIMTWTDY